MAIRKLLVEGNDDKHVVINLCMAYQIPEVFEVIDKKGINNLLETLPIELKTSDLESLGILVDADTNLQARWQSLRNTLTQAGYTVPKTPVSTGTILQNEERPTVGIWLMPNNQLPGLLENFVAELIPVGDGLWTQAQDCVANLPERRFPAVARAKADIHTWLAWQAEPGKPMGTAITARYLDPGSARAQDFMTWLRTLFVN